VEAEAVVLQRNTTGKITYVRHAVNKGLAAARNSGIRLARGEFVTYLDDDDLYYPDHLQTLVHCLDNNDCAVAYTDANRAHQVQRGSEVVVTHRDTPYSVDFNHDQILIGNFIPVLCVMHRRDCLEQTGLFDESLTTHEDWDLWIRLSRKYRFGHIRKTTCEFSWRTDGTSMTSSRQNDFLRTIEMIYSKTEEQVRGKPQLVDARNRYLEEKRLNLKRETDDTKGRRAHVSRG
jgi:cellulose synthase/poly-beta-1,6-N-acetylglucosamine synthase-like glycosyltransferase